MNTDYFTAPPRRGQSPSAPNNLKYAFDPTKSIIFDVEVFPGPRWCCGFLAPDGTHTTIDGDKDRLAETLNKIGRAGRTLCGYNSQDYDLPVLRAVLAGEDAFQISRALIAYDGPGLPPELRDRIGRWPKIKADHVDLAARTRMNGRFPALKVVAANLGCKDLQELPFEPDQELTDQEWIEVKQYNRKDLDATWLVLDHFSPELMAIAELSHRYGMDLRSIHQAGIAQRILCTAYRDRHGQDPIRIVPPAHVRYTPPAPVRRPQNEAAAAWHDRLVAEAFPLDGDPPKPVIPEPAAPIIIGGVELRVGSGGLHSVDQPALHRSDAEHEIYEADVASFYPSLMAQFEIFPSSLGSAGLDQFKEVLAERLEIKERAGAAVDPAEAKRFRVQSNGLKIVLNSTFGQFGNPYAVLYDPTAFLAVTLSGQLLLLDLVERLVAAGAEILSVNTDGLFFKVQRSSDAWHKVLAGWEVDTGMVLETAPLEALLVEATNHYATLSAAGVKRRGNLSDIVDWRHVPKHQVVADAVVAALLHGVLPEHSVRRCTDPARFVCITRRDSTKDGYLVNDATGEATALPRLTRWYKAKDSPFRIEHRWTDAAGKAHKTTPPGATGIQLLMDLPEPGQVLGDIDRNWYVGAARARILANRDFPHLDPKWIHGISQDLHARGLAPSPHWAGKKSPRGTKKDCPSYFWEWSRYDAFGTFTGPEVGVLALDVDEPAKFRKWLEGLGSLDDCLVSYHRADSPEAVRAGTAKGKLIFQFAVSADHPLAKVGKAALRATIGLEIFYGHGDPSILGEHPDGPEQEYLLSDDPLGPPPEWLLADLVERASKRVRVPKEKGSGGKGGRDPAAVVAVELAKVAAAPEGERHSQLVSSVATIANGCGAAVLEEVVPQLVETATVPEAEVVDIVQWMLDKQEDKQDGGNGHVGGNGESQPECPTIEITTKEHAVNDQIIDALAADPNLYSRASVLNRVLRESPRPDDDEWLRDPGTPTIAPIHASTLREQFTKYANWVKRKKDEDGEWALMPDHPPHWSVQAVMNRGMWPGIRRLTMVTEMPLLLPNSTVLETPGYHDPSGILYVPEIMPPRIPTNPTATDVKVALKLLYDVVVDFPFKDDNHKAAWLAALLTPLARPAIRGSCPLFLFDASAAGTGKTMLCDLCSILATGRMVGRTTYPTSEEEMGKSLLSIAVAGSRLVLFDNSATGGSIGGAALDAALTGSTCSGRILGATRYVADIPLNATFYCTGNNIALKGDTVRRTILCRLDSPEDRPEERDNFKIPNLLADVRKRRGILAAAAMILLRAYHVAGRPIPTPKPPPMGAPFGAWDALVRHAVRWVTGHDPCATKTEARSADKFRRLLPGLIAGWANLCSTAPNGLSSAEALKILNSNPGAHEDLHNLLTELTKDGKLPSTQILGNFLGLARGQKRDGRSIERSKSDDNHWYVQTQPQTPETPPTTKKTPEDTPF